jgi:hypothetical protein
VQDVDRADIVSFEHSQLMRGNEQFNLAVQSRRQRLAMC